MSAHYETNAFVEVNKGITEFRYTFSALAGRKVMEAMSWYITAAYSGQGEEVPRIEVDVGVPAGLMSAYQFSEMGTAILIMKERVAKWQRTAPKLEDFKVGGKEWRDAEGLMTIAADITIKLEGSEE